MPGPYSYLSLSGIHCVASIRRKDKTEHERDEVGLNKSTAFYMDMNSVRFFCLGIRCAASICRKSEQSSRSWCVEGVDAYLHLSNKEIGKFDKQVLSEKQD